MPRASGSEVAEQSCIAQSVVVGQDAALFWPQMFYLLSNLLTVSVLLRMVLKQKPETTVAHASRPTWDAEVSAELSSHPSPTVDSPRRSDLCSAPSAQLGSRHMTESVTADEVPTRTTESSSVAAAEPDDEEYLNAQITLHPTKRREIVDKRVMPMDVAALSKNGRQTES